MESRPIRICKNWWFEYVKFDADFHFFHFLYRKCPLWFDLVQKFKIVSLSWNLIPRLFRIFVGSVHLFCFRPFSSFVEKIYLAFYCYLITLPAAYLQSCDASGFFASLKCERSEASNSQFGFPGYQPWFAIAKFLFKL